MGERAREVVLTVDRESVAMGDDVDSHREVWVLPETATVTDLLVAMSRRFLPPVQGFSGWLVSQDFGDRGWGDPLGLIYCRGSSGDGDRYICRARSYPNITMASLAQRAPAVVVRAYYLSGQAARPVSVAEAVDGPLWTGAEPVRAWSEAAEDARQDWRLLQRLDALSASAAGVRREWVRVHLLGAAVPAAVEVFAARQMPLVAMDICPAGMRDAAESFLGGAGDATTVFGNVPEYRASVALIAGVLSGFEWALTKGLRSPEPQAKAVVYLEFLAQQGYRLSPIEQFLAGWIRFDQLGAALGDT